MLEKALFINLKITHGGGWVLSVRLLHKKRKKEKKKILPPNVSQKLKLKKILQDEGYDLVIPIQYLNSNDMDSIIKYIETGDIDLGNERIYNYIQKTNLS